MALAFAGKAVAASAISSIVRKSFDYLEKYTKAEGVKSVKGRLEMTLPQVQVVFDAIDMERIRDSSEALDAWLWQLRDAVEEAEDVLDEVEYYKLEKKVKTRGNKVSTSLYKCKRMFTHQFNAMLNVGTYKRMVEAMKKLDQVTSGVERFILLVDRFDPSSLRHICHQEIGNPRETSSFLVDETIIGRDTERDQVAEWLVEEEWGDYQNHDACNVNTLAIVGIGGMGKTTLAQAVYNDQRVKQCFDQLIWICVSNDFDAHGLTKKIVQETTGRGTDVTCLNTLQEILRGKLSSKKFLLVFDDVWNDERRPDWEKLVAPLKFGQQGSKILLTTRMQSVVDIVERVLEGRTKSLRLEGLQDNDLLAVLNKHAFFGVNPDDHMNLQEIGKQITKKLSGSPLAAKVLGGLLNNSMDSIYWNRMLREDISNIEHGNEGVIKVLRLSYHHLPPHLQACFRYCTMFREDYRFEKDELVNLWMGSGLIQSSVDENQRPEDVGEHYLGILIRKSFFELQSNKSSDLYNGSGEFSNEYYMIHDLLHELGRTVSKKECIRISSDDYGSIPRTVRHAIVGMVNHTVFTDFFALKKLRTLLISFDETIKKGDQWAVMEEVLKVATKLRVLRVDRSSLFKLPDAFGNLMHLRYLYHRGPWQVAKYSFWCPCSIYKLYHLQMIRLNRCLLVSWGLGNLVNLRHLYIDGRLFGFLSFVGHLTSLQNFDCDLTTHGFKARHLEDLTDLCHLHVHGLQNVNVQEATLAKLGEKKNLITLSLTWQSGQLELNTEEHVLNNLQPHTNLAKLKIEGYNGSRSPCWMENPILTNLTYISLSGCNNWQHLPPLGRLSSLKYLYLKDMRAVKIIEDFFYGCEDPSSFPSLKLLCIERLPALEEWVEMEDRILFPQLEALFILQCRALRNIPSKLPSTIAYLEIEDVGLTSLPAIYHSSETSIPPKPSNSRLKISRCPNLVTLGQENCFLGLEEIRIEYCENLLNLPMDGLQALAPLQTLRLMNCPKLMVPQADITLPSSIKQLFVGPCGVYETFLLNSLCSLTSLTTLSLHNCTMTALPYAEVCRSLTTVQHLSILHCSELASLDGIEELTSLTEFEVIRCDKLLGITSQQMFEASDLIQAAAVCPSHLRKLDKLCISTPFLLQLKPLRRVSSVTNLTIHDSCRCLPEEWLMQNCNHLKRLGVLDASQLEFLPSIMARFTSLETLELKRAVLIQSLPELPASLRVLQFLGCHPVLHRRCQKSRGPDWHKVAQIPDLRIVQDLPSSYTWHSC